MYRLIVLLLSLLFVACADRQMLDLAVYVEQIKARPASGISLPVAPTKIDAFAYIAGERRDPFAAQLALLETQRVPDTQDIGTVQPDAQRRKETLENYPLDSLRMVGTMTRSGARWALVSSQDGVIHRVTAGNHMGQRHGRVIKINENRISLVELVPAANGFREKHVALGLGNVE